MLYISRMILANIRFVKMRPVDFIFADKAVLKSRRIKNKGADELKKIISILLAALMAAGLLTSCSEGGGGVTIEGRDDFPATVSGVEIKSAPQKVICLSPSVTEIIYELGSYAQLYGVSNDCDYPEEAAQKEKMGTAISPDTEKIINASPDLVIVSGNLNDELSESLKLRNIPVISIEAAQNIDSLKDVYVAVATAFAGKTTGQINGETTYNNLINKIKNEANLAGQTLKKAVFIPSDGIIAYKDSFISDIMTLAGAENPAEAVPEGSDWASYVASLNPDYIFCSDGIVQSILENPALAETNAVKSGNVKGINPALFERQGGRIYEAAMEMYRAMYGAEDNTSGTDVSGENSAAGTSEALSAE